MDWPANRMYYPAMRDPVETPYSSTAPLLTGHFREAQGYRAYRPNGVDDWLLVLTLSGGGRFGHEGGEVTTVAGVWMLLPPGTAHDYRVADGAPGWELLWAHFQPRADWHALLDWPILGGALRGMTGNADLSDQFLRVHQHLISGRRRAEALAMNAMETLFLACDEHLASVADTIDRRVERAMRFVETHLAEPLSVATIAAEAGLSPSRLAHLFRDVTGQSLQAFVEQRRMVRAADLLRRTSFPVKRVAAEVGFESPFYFSRRFARWSGKSPVAFRQGG
ncbi:helix-turn-helix domain-containing protein [Devosia sediminis]|uniref:Helix-turn-helix domain-containing protein n=1 Tax=Devosia sediminis TaxID=2798801 RepID=A0A934MKB4_9HYPH|nr:helix-turn-helix domain-containing protein [Devosia sediminis]MBJ3783376.1 helix-turn-helix domain-containing protein [Devosia sediminis]